MKIRNGFISNSSSSSFLVIFPREPKSIEDVKQILFGDKEYYYAPYNEKRYTTQEVAQTVFNDIQKQTKNNLNEAKQLLINCHESGIDIDDFVINPNADFKNRKYDWEAHSKSCKKWADEFLEDFFSLKKIRKIKLEKIEGKNTKNIDGIFYIFEYGDDFDYESALEHGNLFEGVKHFRINNH